jgi:hypothetical protein
MARDTYHNLQYFFVVALARSNYVLVSSGTGFLLAGRILSRHKRSRELATAFSCSSLQLQIYAISTSSSE